MISNIIINKISSIQDVLNFGPVFVGALLGRSFGPSVVNPGAYLGVESCVTGPLTLRVTGHVGIDDSLGKVHGIVAFAVLMPPSDTRVLEVT